MCRGQTSQASVVRPPTNKYIENTARLVNATIRRIEQRIHRTGKKSLERAGDLNAAETLTQFRAQVMDPATIEGDDTEEDSSTSGDDPEIITTDEDEGHASDESSSNEDFISHVSSEDDEDEEAGEDDGDDEEDE